jgi:prefoldin subunit 5
MPTQPVTTEQLQRQLEELQRNFEEVTKRDAEFRLEVDAFLKQRKPFG